LDSSPQSILAAAVKGAAIETITSVLAGAIGIPISAGRTSVRAISFRVGKTEKTNRLTCDPAVSCQRPAPHHLHAKGEFT
jgi:hypothetical protein